ncbi:MAG: Glycine oxidase ThiO (EC [uncultured Thiotrichaceae bacterium]|uniref:Glycine oxidase ThiO (EC) n=1 Tax=uncultured Thiotrichaceae bacterium TaxID=298394 RepID=A0A6S6TQ97_9GAMM|nr:MAG: Glycine oxidase ThiO (EC [uncultured Thiotrichaceae bacterium]
MKLAIVGAGLAGRLLTWRVISHCRELGKPVSVTLCDRQSRDFVGTGLIAAAMVAPYTEAVTTDPATQALGTVSADLWRKWLPELEAATGQLIHFNQQGTLVVAHPADLADWQRFKSKAENTLPTGAMQHLNAQAIRQAEPELSGAFSQALYFPEEGVIDNAALYTALNTWFDEAPEVTWLEGVECGYFPEADATDQRSAGSAPIAQQGYLDATKTHFDYVFDCRGNDARPDLASLRSVRGEILRVYAPEVSLNRSIRLMHPRYPLYIAPRPDHHYVIGATQIESDDSGSVTIRSALELLSALYSLHTGFAEARIESLQAGLRPAFNDNLPRIVREQQLIRVNGLFRHGYLFAPALIDEVIQSIC